MVVSMVAAGEGAGNLPDMLEKVSDFYTKEVDAAVSALTSMIEPALIVGLGAIVTVVVLAIYLPIFQMATGID
jgi:type IV pilus assembly protein PilC